MTVQEQSTLLTREKMLSDTEQFLTEFADDYKRMAE